MKLQNLDQIQRMEVEEYGYCEDDKEAEAEIAKAIAEGRHKEAEYDPSNQSLIVSVEQADREIVARVRLVKDDSEDIEENYDTSFHAGGGQ